MTPMIMLLVVAARGILEGRGGGEVWETNI